MSPYAPVNTTAIDVANYILVLAKRDSAPIDPLTLQKILYYCQCWSLRDGKKLFNDPVEAWKHGPVVRNVWKAHSGSRKIEFPDDSFYELTPDQIELVQGVWESIKHLHGTTLSDKTHEPDSAWSRARGDLPKTAESDRLLSCEDMADDAEKIRHSAETRLLTVWDDLAEFQQ